MIEVLQYGFMQRAFIAGIMVAVTCPLIGTFIVLKRLSMIGDTLSHASLAGIAAGMLWGFYPFWGALVFSILAAILIERLRKSFAGYEELSNSIILSTGIALAVVFVGLAKGYNADLMGYLFGSIAAVSKQDIYIMLFLSAVIIVSVVVLYHKLFYISFDSEGAQVSGISVSFLNFYITLLASFTIVVSTRIVGIFMVSSLLVLPVATAMQMGKGFKKSLFISIIFALIAVIFGLLFSYYLDIASGGAIVLFSVLMLIIVLIIKPGKEA